MVRPFAIAPAALLLTLLSSSTLVAQESTSPVSFVNDVVPVLTKAGCNSGPCHAKAPDRKSVV